MNNYPLTLRDGHTTHTRSQAKGQGNIYLSKTEKLCFQSIAFGGKVFVSYKKVFPHRCTWGVAHNIMSPPTAIFHPKLTPETSRLTSVGWSCLSLAVAQYNVPAPGREHSAPLRPFFIQKLTQQAPQHP